MRWPRPARARRPELASKLLLRKRRSYEDDLALMREVADALIAERKRDPDAAQKKDLLGLMLQGRDPVTGEGLSDENIRYQLITFLIAGHETTSGMLSFATYFLIKNPQVLLKARAEVDAALGEEMPRLEHMGRLRYIEQVLMESLRIWPTAPAFQLRAREDTVIGGRHAIGRRDTLMVLTPMLHRDPEVWGDLMSRPSVPSASRPRRWRSCRRTRGNRSATASAPASAGRSRCRRRCC